MTNIQTDENRRKFYRIKLHIPLCTEMTINNCHGKLIKTGILNICVKDIGPGGLSFISKLCFPVDKEIVYNFNLNVLEKKYIIKGIIVRRNEIEKNLYNYGVQFVCKTNEETENVKLFNKLSIILKRNLSNSNCKFCDKTTYPC